MQKVELDMFTTCVAAGEQHCLSIDAKGNAYSWGMGKFGKTGLGHEGEVRVPERITTLDKFRRDMMGHPQAEN
jgi:alpha-tubulin suppressor-like RCC1 family protein